MKPARMWREKSFKTSAGEIRIFPLLVRAVILLTILAIVAVAILFIHESPKPKPFAAELYVDPTSNAAQQAEAWQWSRPDAAALMRELASVPSSKWITGEATYDSIQKYVDTANHADKTPVLVAYNIPHRDCGQYSSGGAEDTESYQTYVNRLTRAVSNMRAIIILEPDALAQIAAPDREHCLDGAQTEQRYSLLRYAVEKLSAQPHTAVYIDAGNSGWIKTIDTLVESLKKSGVDHATGLSINVSNFHTTDDSIEYGNRLSDSLGGKHYVIDTSRNGLGEYHNEAQPAYNWCNPPGRAIGEYPTADTGKSRVDAYLHIKNIGESDGSDPDPNKCHGGPPAGTWWPEYALDLVSRWPDKFKDKHSSAVTR